MIKLLFLFTLVPLMELWLLIEIGRYAGTWPTIILVASTGFIGVLLAKSQGMSTIFKMRDELEQGIVPGGKIFDGVCILLGGAFLMTPGLITDILGFSLLIPVTREAIKKISISYFQRKIEQGEIYFRKR